MRPLTCFLTTAVLLMFVSCKTQTFEPSFKTKLIGKWKYTGGSGGFTGKPEPVNPLVSKIIEFKSDGKYVKYINSDPDTQGTYDIIKSKSIYSSLEDNAIRFDPQSGSPRTGLIATINDDKLVLADNVYDGFSAGYTRVK